jgi:hypothetical protein
LWRVSNVRDNQPNGSVLKVRDLDIPVKIVGGELLREADGLAMSSRNVYLSPVERTQVCYLIILCLIFSLVFASVRFISYHQSCKIERISS